MSANPRSSANRPRHQWLAPTGLILLSLIPVSAGATRLTELTGGAVVTEENARFFGSPVPVVTHIVSVTIFSLLGAFQFVPALRGKRGWHRVAGRILIPAGLLTALSGMWMASFYPHPVGDGVALLVLRLIFGSAMIACIVFGIRAVLHHDFVVHSAWMTRAYAIAMGAGTQAIVLIPGSIIFGPTHELSRAVLMGAAWVINLAVAERIIRHRARRLPGRSPSAFVVRPVISLNHSIELTGKPDSHLSRWLWLAKMFLAVPHFAVLALLWAAFVVTTLVAGVSILFTGRYPRALFDFNVGVMRWNWRVGFYVWAALGTDRYPPFTLGRADYPADFDVAYPVHLSRGLVLVKWLLAAPHLVVLALLLTDLVGYPWGTAGALGGGIQPASGYSALNLLVVVGGFFLLITGRFPRGLSDLLLGVNRWMYRVLGYVALLRDEYPPFRLDAGPEEPLSPASRKSD